MRLLGSVLAMVVAAGSVVAPAAPAAAAGDFGPGSSVGVTWQRHWKGHRGDGSVLIDEMTGTNPMCGGYIRPSAPGGPNWLVHHTHYAPTFTVLPNTSITFTYQPNKGMFGVASLYLELERDYTTGQYWPVEDQRPKLFQANTGQLANGTYNASIAIPSSLRGHQVKLQFRCSQPYEAPSSLVCTSSCYAASFAVYNISIPALGSLYRHYSPELGMHVSKTESTVFQYNLEGSLGLILGVQLPGTHPIYQCHTALGGYRTEKSAGAPDCLDPYYGLSVIGYLYDSPQGTSSRLLVACHAPGMYGPEYPDYFDSYDPGCEGASTDFVLGYALTSQPTPAPVWW